MTEDIRLAVIGGSGLYSMQGLEDVQQKTVKTPFGAPSSPVMIGTLAGQRVAFLARHGIGHMLTPSEVNYRANIYALKSLGARFVLSVNACGSLREDFEPGHIVIPNQLYDHTHLRARSFFGDGLVAHVGVAEPFCAEFSQQIFTASEAAGATAHLGGSFITIEGPRFSTRVESNTYRSWGLDIIGMTTSPEAFLAREAELHYGVVAHITDYDVWHKEPVSVEMVVRTLNQNTAHAQATIRELAGQLNPQPNCDCEQALANAMMTARDKVPAATRKKLGLLVDKYLG
jgi:5'-methylthioadenosine phosphorylase